MQFNRRSYRRIPIRLFVDQFKSQEHWIGLSCNLSEGGLYLCQKPQPIPGEMAIELNLPGEAESIWTKAEVCSIGDQGGFMGVGLTFTAMAQKHRILLRDWIWATWAQLSTDGDERRGSVRQLLAA